MTAPQELRTSRLLLRSLESKDIPAIVRLAGVREVSDTTTNIPHPYTGDDARSFLAHAQNEFRAERSAIFAITTQSKYPGGDFCGAVGLTIATAHQRAELGYWVGVPYWGQGFATEAAAAVLAFAFETLRLHRIHASHFVGNIASQQVLKKIGMRHEGCSREHIHKWGRFIDLENYGLLAAEFREAKEKA